MSSAEQASVTGGVNDGELVFERDDCSLWYHPAIKLVHHCMHKPVSSKNFRQMLITGAELLEKNGAQKWLSDDRTHKVLSQEDAEWGQTLWFPRARAAGFEYWGIVMPTAAIGKLNINRFAHDYAQRGVQVRVADNPEELFGWLCSF